MTACEHQWEWVQPRIVTIGESTATNQGPAHVTYNARCSKCGETTWAHGWNVTVPDPTK